MIEGSTEYFGYKNSHDGDAIYRDYVIIPGEKIDASLKGRYFVGLDYHDEWNPESGNIALDGYYNDWIICITPGFLKGQHRIIAEDLSAEEDGDFDFFCKFVDKGVRAMFFYQRAVARLAPRAGFDFGSMPYPEQLKKVQAAMEEGDDRARKIYETIGIEFGYTIAYFADFYDVRNLLFLGRVATGEGGQIIIDKANEVLKGEFPQLSITLCVPDEKTKRHGQAVAAASLPKLG